MSSLNDLPIGVALERENKMAVGTGNFLVKVWFEAETGDNGLRTPDLIQAFASLIEARSSCEFLKEMNGVDAVYILRLKPYRLVERVVCFPNAR